MRRLRTTRSFTLAWVTAVLAVVGSTAPAVASDGTAATAKARAITRIEAPVSIAANQDLVLGAIRWRSSDARRSGLRVSRSVSGFAPSTGRTRAFFVVTGYAEQMVSVAVPRRIQLSGREGIAGVLIETSSTTDLAATSGALIVGLRGRMIADAGVTGGVYSGVLVATAQYN